MSSTLPLAKADLFTSVDSGLPSCSDFSGPLSQVGTDHVVVDIPFCTWSGINHASFIHIAASAATGNLHDMMFFLGDGENPVTAISSFDFPVRDTTAQPADIAFLVTGNASIQDPSTGIAAILGLSLNGNELDHVIVDAIFGQGPSNDFTFDDLFHFHISGQPAGIATAMLSVSGAVTEGVVGADITAAEVPEPSSIIFLASCLGAVGACRTLRKRRA